MTFPMANLNCDYDKCHQTISTHSILLVATGISRHKKENFLYVILQEIIRQRVKSPVPTENVPTWDFTLLFTFHSQEIQLPVMYYELFPFTHMCILYINSILQKLPLTMFVMGCL